MFYVKLGFRNLLKHRRRSAITLLAISLGFAALLVARGYVNYCLWGLKESIINGGTGHFQVFKKGYKSRNEDDGTKFLMQDYKKIIRALSAVGGIKFIAPRLDFTGMISSDDRNTVVMAHGGWLEEEKILTTFSTITQGAFPDSDEGDGILLGAGAARLAALDVGDSCTISAAMPGGAVNAMDLSVAGLLRNQLEEMENVYALVPLATAQRLLGVPNAVDTLIIMMVGTAGSDEAERGIAKVCEANGLEYRRWDQIVPYYVGARDFYASSMDVALIVILAIVLLSIANTMLMVVFERIREIGTIRSLGTTRSQVLRIIGVESGLLGVMGCLIGAALALLVAAIVNALGGIPLPPPPGNSRAYQGLIYLDFMDVAIYGMVYIAISIVSAFYPALKAIRMSVSDSLRWQ